MNPEYLLQEGLARIWYYASPKSGSVRYMISAHGNLTLQEAETALKGKGPCSTEFVKHWGTQCSSEEEINVLVRAYIRHLQGVQNENNLAMSLECVDH